MIPTPKQIKTYISKNVVVHDGKEYVTNAENLVNDVRNAFENTMCIIEKDKKGQLHFIVKILSKSAFRKCVDCLVMPPQICVHI